MYINKYKKIYIFVPLPLPLDSLDTVSHQERLNLIPGFSKFNVQLIYTKQPNHLLKTPYKPVIKYLNRLGVALINTKFKKIMF